MRRRPPVAHPGQLNVPPGLLPHNVVYQRVRHSELCRQRLAQARTIGGPDSANVSFAQFGGVVSGAPLPAASTFPPALRVHVLRVVQRRPCEEMRRIAANRVIAPMADKGFAGVAFGHNVGQPVNVMAGSLEGEAAVAPLLPRPWPFPALIIAALCDPKPERAAGRAISLEMPLAGERNRAVRASNNNHLPLISNYFARRKDRQDAA